MFEKAYVLEKEMSCKEETSARKTSGNNGFHVISAQKLRQKGDF